MSFKLVTLLAMCAVVHGGIPWLPAPSIFLQVFMARHQQLLDQTKQHAAEAKVIFIGDSITQGWAADGKAVWDAHYANRGAFNYGCGGDRTENVLWRIANGELDGLHPKLVVLKIGTNNIGTNKPGEIANGVLAILNTLHVKMPNAKVLLLSVLPRTPKKLDDETHAINSFLVRLADNQRVHYLDLAVHFELAGHQFPNLYVPDHLHLSALGYQMWYQVMEPSFQQLTA